MNYEKGRKVRHKAKGVVETVVGLCKIKYMGAWVDGVIYEGNDVKTGEPMTFVRVKEDFDNNFEIDEQDHRFSERENLHQVRKI